MNIIFFSDGGTKIHRGAEITWAMTQARHCVTLRWPLSVPYLCRLVIAAILWVRLL